MSTEWEPLSMSTPPPAILRSLFQRSRIETRLQKEFSKRSTCPSKPDSRIALVSMMSST